MTARVSFVGRARETGAAVGWLLLFTVVGIGLTIGVSELVPGVGGPLWFLARNGLYEVAGFGGATWLVGRWLNRYSWEWIGWPAPVRRTLPRHFLRGVAIGAAMAAGAILLAVTLGGAAVHLTAALGGFTVVAVPLAVGFLAASLGEELMFRGYPLRRLADAIGPGPAVAVLALGFAAAHLNNPEVGTLGVVNIALAAVWFAAAFFSAGGMALAWGLHFGWNATLGLVFDAPVSGFRFDVPGIDYLPGAHAWLDGGRFGPEGGLVGTLAVLGGLALVLGGRIRQPRTWLTAVAA